jgi:hypothetical protein
MTTKITRTETKVKVRRSIDKLSKKQEAVLEDLIVSAKTWGWLEESGVGKRVDNAEKAFNEAVANMRKMLIQQNTRIRKLRERGDSPNPLISKKPTI